VGKKRGGGVWDKGQVKKGGVGAKHSGFPSGWLKGEGSKEIITKKAERTKDGGLLKSWG